MLQNSNNNRLKSRELRYKRRFGSFMIAFGLCISAVGVYTFISPDQIIKVNGYPTNAIEDKLLLTFGPLIFVIAGMVIRRNPEKWQIED